MPSDDMALVREYAQRNSERAFATLVSRHVNLVYSVALRQVGDPHSAEEITQGVFIILARKAKSLSPETILSGWLCRTARYVSGDTLKTQRRRQIRERESQMQSTLNDPERGLWNQIAPLLDEALNCLGKKEHDAVVLRFFDGKELKQVGAAMGTTEDAARMRVNRGLDKLRNFFTTKGVSLSTTAIAGAVAANSVQAAPTGLAATITATALSGTTITTAAVIAATKSIAMTTLQKSVVATTIAVLTGAGIYEARQAANASAEVQALQQQQAPLAAQIQQLQRERDETARQLSLSGEQSVRTNQETVELLRLRAEVTRLKSLAKPETTSESATLSLAESWMERVSSLKAKFAQTPGATIPELDYLTPKDWMEATKNEIRTEDYYRIAMAYARHLGEHTFAGTLHNALVAFQAANKDELPTEITQLVPYFQPPVREDVLQRYQILPADQLNFPAELMRVITAGKNWVITQKAPIDKQFDYREAIGVASFMGLGPGLWLLDKDKSVGPNQR